MQTAPSHQHIVTFATAWAPVGHLPQAAVLATTAQVHAVVPPVAALSSLRYADFWALSATGCVPLSALVKYVAVCVRVCWYCHQSGGTDVVDLPDILLPAGQYLDLFDSESETDVPSDSSDEELVEV